MCTIIMDGRIHIHTDITIQVSVSYTSQNAMENNVGPHIKQE